MTLAVLFTPAARLEIIEASEWYEGRAVGLGVAFQTEIDRQIARISDGPLRFPVLISDVRRARLRRFPYSLFFRIETEGVFVIACFHASQDPRKWEQRT